MYTFFIIVFLIYGSFHAYAFLRAFYGLSLSPISGAVLALLMVFMLFSPLLVRVLEKSGNLAAAVLMGYASYVWMGFIFLFLCSSLLVDFYRLAIWALHFIFRQMPGSLSISAFAAFVAPLAAAFIITVYGAFEAINIRAESVALETARLDAQKDKLRIVQITDIHLGLMVGPQRLERILEIVKQARPDILISTGDLIDGDSSTLSRSIEMLKEVNPPLGKFAVTGNHEFYAGIERALAITREAGFKVLRQESFTIPGIIRIAGVDDREESGTPLPGNTPGNTIDEKVLSPEAPEFTLFLKHRPVVSRSTIGKFDLQLSGHAHRGQIFPFRLITKLFFPLDSGLYRLSENSYLYASRGTGTWGPPIRFLSPPEVTIIDLVRKSQALKQKTE